MNLNQKIKQKTAQARLLKPERLLEIKIIVNTEAFSDLLSQAKLSLYKNISSTLPEHAYYHHMSGNLMIEKFIDTLYSVAESHPDESTTTGEDDD